MKYSNTQITAFNTCEKQHDFMYRMQLEPAEKSLPLYRGIVGHKALEVYYKSLQVGADIDVAYDLAKHELIDEIERVTREEPWNTKYLTQVILLDKRLYEYSKYYENEPFQVLHVEEPMEVALDESDSFVFIPDLVVEITRGQYKGQLALYDHKFVYNFYTFDELKLSAQLPKYRKALGRLGLDIKLIIYNQIRTRDFKWTNHTDIFRRSESLVTDLSGEQMWFEQNETIKKIKEAKYPLRALAPMVCKGCWFKEPCYTQMEGKDASDILSFEYKKRERPLKEIFND